MHERKLTRSEWLRTPYAKSDAKNPDGAIQSLLSKYKVAEIMTAQYVGPHGRPGYGVRFVLQGKPYRVAIETLLADATPDELRTQAKRVVYHYLKSVLEVTNVFISVEEALFAHLELSDEGGRTATAYEIAQPAVAKLSARSFSALMLPPAKEEGR